MAAGNMLDRHSLSTALQTLVLCVLSAVGLFLVIDAFSHLGRIASAIASGSQAVDALRASFRRSPCRKCSR
ncbi:MAG: hypothetical protein U5N86_06985 [Planctomycetota bacterium]|nr:hypothetical protein [Planctomycetota bacterium]